jgi:uncharacterized YccA/Bax inhibitor family protein
MPSPMLQESTFQRPTVREEVDGSEAMTIGGTVAAAIVLLVVLVMAGAIGWSVVEPAPAEGAAPLTWLVPVVLAAGGLAVWTGFRPRVAPYAAPAYAALEGLALGAVSHAYETASNGVVLQAIGATVAVLLVQLVLHASGLVRATPRFLEVLFAAGLATILLYAVVLSAHAVGFSATFLGTEAHVVVSLVSAGVAAFFLFADFQVIEEGARDRAPRYMEWYAALGLVLTLVWLYLELLALMGDEDGGGD